MDFKQRIFEVIAALIIVVRRFLLLILVPYKTMRRICNETDMMQVYIIFTSIFVYFHAANRFREYEYEPIILFLMTVVHFVITVLFFFMMSGFLQKKQPVEIKPLVSTLAYTLLPTIIWFSTSSILYALLPPPRNINLLGMAFSMLYISFSITLLIWKIILLYLALRFSTQLAFYRIIYMIMLYLLLAIPYSLVLYAFDYFRIPFI
ncbi:MAG: hypothetical protein ACEQSA_03910 [Weeksellaceae bacterium]